MVLKGGEVIVGSADPLPAPTISEPLMSSSDEVGGVHFLITGLPLMGPLPLPIIGGAPGEVGLCGSLMGGRERGRSCPGRLEPLVRGVVSPRARRA